MADKLPGPAPALAASSPGTARETFLLVQVLRAVAAIMVVVHHTTYMLQERLEPAHGPWLPGAAGVDLFFVISGFVMALSSQALTGSAHPTRTFLARRLERVVPMYWLATTAKLALAVSFPLLAPRVASGAWHIVASYLFLPSISPLGAVHPVLLVGWTLNSEMFFYLVVAIGLALRLRVLPYLCVSLALLGTAGVLRPPWWPTVLWAVDPLLFEFLLGVLLAAALPKLRTLGTQAPARSAASAWATAWTLAMAAGFFVLVTRPLEVLRSDRALVWGVAAAVVVGSALALERALGRAMPRWLLELGDASYSIYLSHTLVLAGLGYAFTRLGWLARMGWTLSTIACLAICVLVAEAIYRGVELPLIRFFKGRRPRATPALG